MYLQDKTNLVINQSVNKNSFSRSTATTKKAALLIADRFNFIKLLEALSRKKSIFDQLNPFIAKNSF